MRPLMILAVLLVCAGPALAASPTEALDRMFRDVPDDLAPSGILLDRALPLAGIGELDGRAESPAIGPARLRQVAWELRRASTAEARIPDLATFSTRGPEIPVVVLDFAYDRIREDAPGLAARSGEGLALEATDLRAGRVFAAAPLRTVVHRADVTFRLDDWFTNRDRPVRVRFDAGDGPGYRDVPADGRIRVRYPTTGSRTLRVEARYADASIRIASSRVFVEALMTPAPDDTLQITASVSHEGSASSGEAYLYFAAGRSTLEQPIVLIEGFDLDDSMNWDEIYALLNSENLIEDIRAEGYDIVVLNFDDATTDLQRNAYLVVELLEQVQASIDPAASVALAGASMGGLCSRFALAWMEQNGVAHRVRTFLSFDAPQAGASIPLGLQYWLDFFSGESADAAFLLSRLDRPAARQMLVYHHQSPPVSPAIPDPLRGSFQAELAGLGDYPVQPRLVAIANGSGSRQDQGFAPGAQLLRWSYDSFLVDIRGNVWAVGDGPDTRIFEGLIDPFLLPATSENVFVAGSSPFDSAPGGSRASMAQADSTEAPYGDIVALQPSHCFIPTVSALDLETGDLFLDVAALADPAALSPFDAVYFPAENQEHVAITAENAQWFKDELLVAPTATAPAPLAVTRLTAIAPNPFNPRTTIHFEVSTAGKARLEVFDLRGRRITTLLDEEVPAGPRRVEWNGRDDSGRGVASGIYVARLESGAAVLTRRMALVR